MNIINLSGGKIYYTTRNQVFYEVLKGRVLVYLVPTRNGKKGRRLFLIELNEGEKFPAFASDSSGSWNFGIMAVDKAQITEYENTENDELIMQFAEKINIFLSSPFDFEEEIIEKYNINAVKDEGYIYITEEERSKTREKTLRIILNHFSRDTDESSAFTETGNNLYDAAAYICKKEKIRIADIDRIIDCSGRRFSLNDISRVSHFTIREIVLEDNWFRHDSGVILAYRESDNQPVACIPQGPYKYEVYIPADGTKQRLTKKICSGLKPKAFMFYRPFPDKPMKKKDLFLFGMSKVYKSDIVRLFLLALLGTLIGLLIPYMNEQAYDKFIPMGNSSGLAQIGILLLAFSLGNITFTIVKNLASFRSMNSMEYAAQSAAFDRLFNLPSSFYREYNSAELGQKIMGISTIYNILAQSLTTSLLSALFSLLYLWRMFKYSKKMTATSFILLVVVLAVIVIIGIRQTKHEKSKRNVDVDAQSDIFQYISGISKIRIAGAEDRALYRYLQKFTVSRGINRKKERMSLLVDTMIGSVQILFSALFFYLMIKKNINLTIGAFTGFTAAFGSFSGAMLTIVQNFLQINCIKPLYDDARPILETLPENSEDSAIHGKINGEIEISNLTFSYDKEEQPVLKDLSLHIRAGEYIGIVGSSGCGKSTLLKLLLGFEKPQIGKIYYDNRDIDELDKRELRKKFGVVLQDGGLISGSIYENIIITSPRCKMNRVNEVIREVGLEDDIKTMPMGLHTVVSENSGTISGGQRQRILIARAIVGKPKVIFLDEATSALDNVTQNMVVETLESINATKIVIAHRLSTVKKCDRIIVMDKGNIAEQGSYDELMERKGLFYNLAIRQI